MAFLNFLSGGGNPLQAMMGGASPGFAGGMFPNNEPPFGINETGGINEALAQNQALGLHKMQQPQKQKLGFADILGLVGDAVRGYRGQEATYLPRMQQQRKEQARNQAFQNYLDDPEGTIRALFAAGDPETALALIKDGQGEGFTLSEGQGRYDSRGKLIAQGPNKQETVEIDGVVFDKRTGQPLFESPYSRIIPGAEGSFYEQPRQGIGRGRAAPQDQPQGASLQAQAEEAIRMGADPAEVNRRLQEMLGGATASPSPTFP